MTKTEKHINIKTKKPKISAIIIAKNEEEKIAECLNSLQWCDEIIVVDTGSTDRTKEIALKHKTLVREYNGGSYDDWRNTGLKFAKGEWVLYIDADEGVSPELREEILNIINYPKGKYNAFAIPRKNIVLGKELRHGGFGKFDYVKRLFIRKKLVKWTGELHEEPNFYYNGRLTIGRSNELGYLSNKLIHLKASTISEMVEKTNKWSDVEAKLMYTADHPPMNILRFLSAMAREFWFRFIKEKAFMDGGVGIIHGIYQIYSRFISYAKLWEMQMYNTNNSNSTNLRTISKTKL
ncbi:MAG: Glycosyl transferase family 2 [Candidatus Woesebacteria bacterium GW2011_GWA1_37_7]|uniref:Glycosyl transferase family 2 n=1 Tax=Candidatus Woesebacteria bacterium GW2011_GWA1_37_7 TaxID=1618545 RepID=A0A0G0JLZ1_9BACT|nr:MAG: Glycosyl transferase family 2 [Candidatus Woesebacteria bacterium GW2011_GWA1_37_7]